MSRSAISRYRTGVVALASLLVSSTWLISTASAAPSSADTVLTPIRGALADSSGNALGTVRYTEDSAGQFFPAGTTTKVTLGLSGHATFTPGVTPTITAPTGYVISGGTVEPTTDPASASYTFSVTAPSTATKAVITVAGLRAGVDSKAVGTISVTSTPGDANPALQVLDSERFGGENRYETAANLFYVGVDTEVFDPSAAVLSSGEGYADALSANYLAGELHTGTILTRAGFLSPEAETALQYFPVETVYITGGTGAVSKAVEDTIKGFHVGGDPKAAKLKVVRLGGKDRYATNKIINDYAGDGFPNDADTALLASGVGFADALALGPIAYAENFPIILTPGGTLGGSANDQLQDRQPDLVVLAGGTASISAAVQDELEADYPRVERYGGAERTATAAAIADWADRNAAFGDDFDSPIAIIANGQGYADALAVGPLAGGNGVPVLLSKNRNELGVGTAGFLGARTVDEIVDVVVIGLDGSTSDLLADRAANAVGAATTAATGAVSPARHVIRSLRR